MRWTSRDDSANPAREVMGSLRPSLATQPHGFEVCSSSPWSTIDYHAELFAQGDNDHQITSFAPTWVANPTISEADTHALEPDERVRLREYGAIPSAELSSAFDPAAIDASFAIPPSGNYSQPVAIIDPNSGGSDAFTLGFACWLKPEFEPPTGVQCGEIRNWDEVEQRFIVTRRYYRVIPGRVGHGHYRKLVNGEYKSFFDEGVPTREETVEVPEQSPKFCLLSAESVPSAFGRGDEIVKHIAQQCRRYGARTVIGDQRESLFLQTAFQVERLQYISIPWTNQNKAEAVRRIRRLMNDRELSLPANEALRKELHNYSERLTANGSAKYQGRGSQHDDHVALVITATLADLERLLPGSPVGRSKARGIVNDC